MKKLLIIALLLPVFFSCNERADNQKKADELQSKAHYPEAVTISGMEHIAGIQSFDSVISEFTKRGYRSIKLDANWYKFIDSSYYSPETDSLTNNLGPGVGFLSNRCFFLCIKDEGETNLSQTFPIFFLAEFKRSLLANNYYKPSGQKLFYSEQTKQQYVLENFTGILGSECSIWYKDSFVTVSLRVPK